MSHIGPVSKEEWAKLRQDSRQSFPDRLSGKDLPAVLLTYQQKLLQTTAVNRVTVVEKSRRTGYTWAVAADAVLTAATARTGGGMDVLYMGYNLDMAREFIDTCGMWAKAFDQAASEVEEFLFKDRDEKGQDRDIQAFRITFASGYQIVALPSRPRSLRGRQGYVIIDEAAFHDDLEELLKAAFALLIWGGKVLIISTHDGDTNPFGVLVEDIKKGRKPYALITLDFDQALKDGLYQRICMVTGREWTPEAEAVWREEIIDIYGDAADEELFVIPSTGSGCYIPAALLERQQRADVPVLRIERGTDFLLLSDEEREADIRAWIEEVLDPVLATLDPDLQSFFGQDYARTGDLSVIWPAQRHQDMVRRPPFVLEMRNMPYAQQRQILWHVVDHLPNFMAGAMDATGNGGPLAEETATRYGPDRIAQVKITQEFYKTEMPPFKAAFEDGLNELPRDQDIFNDHRAIRLVSGVPTIVRESKNTGKGEDAGKGKKKQRHGDSAVADLLSWKASRMEVGEFAYEPAAVNSRAENPYHDEDPDDDSGAFAPGAW